MKEQKVLILILILALFIASDIFAQKSNLHSNYVKDDTVTFAILVVDYYNYEFKKAHISYYPLCDNYCDTSNIPFEIQAIPPDVGYMWYRYNFTGDDLFWGWILWCGHGQIRYPTNFTPAGDFNYTNNHVEFPENAEYFRFLGPDITWEELKTRASIAWNVVDSLELVNEFSQYPFKVGFYPYVPCVGICDDWINWIIFLYRGNDYYTDINENHTVKNDLNVYNEYNTNQIIIQSPIFKERNSVINIYDILGNIMISHEVQRGTLEIKLNLSGFKQGIYIATLLKDEQVTARCKFILD